jgi:DNA (cytosine-5)-methyltransferase 1
VPNPPANGDLPVISLFSGALGLDLGLEQAGLDLRVAVESDRWAANTIRRNRPDLPVIQRKIEDVSTSEILEAAGLQVGEAFLVSAGPSCQAFSTAGARRSLDDPRGTLFREFLRVVDEAKPRFFVMENVRGVLSAAVRHRPLAERGPGFPPLQPEEQHGSAFRLICSELAATGYYGVFDLLNTADYGVAQTRLRLVFIGSRDGEAVDLPDATHAETPRPRRRGWQTLRDVIGDLNGEAEDVLSLQPSYRRFLHHVPEGGNWRDLPENLQREALGRAFDSWGGRVGFFRRLRWDRPAPALTTRPNSRATMLIHPEADRPLSVREYAAIQGFPDHWEFDGQFGSQYKQIGNAVPVALGRALGEALLDTAARDDRRASRQGVVACADPVLLQRFNARPRTVLNPPRMRSDRTVKEETRDARAWTVLHGGALREPLDVVLLDDVA